MELGSITFDKKRQTLTIQGEEKRISTRETQLLEMLVDKKNDILERGYALKKIWGDDSFYNARNMDVYIGRLRRMLRKDDTVFLENVHGVGYKLVVLGPSTEPV